jgi:hypothetical protein
MKLGKTIVTLVFACVAIALIAYFGQSLGDKMLAKYSQWSQLRATRFAEGFSEAAFNAVAVGQSQEDVKAALGEPIGRGWNQHEVWVYVPGGDGDLRFAVSRDGHVEQIIDPNNVTGFGHPPLDAAGAKAAFGEPTEVREVLGELLRLSYQYDEETKRLVRSLHAEQASQEWAYLTEDGKAFAILLNGDNMVVAVRDPNSVTGIVNQPRRSLTTKEIQAQYGEPETVDRNGLIETWVYGCCPMTSYKQRDIMFDLATGEVIEKVSVDHWIPIQESPNGSGDSG